MHIQFHVLSVIGGLGLSLLAGAVQAFECTKINYGTELVESVTYCASSALKASRVSNYIPGNADPYIPDHASKAWCEAAKGTGIGEWLEMTINNYGDTGATIKTLIIGNGYQKSRKSFYENTRPRDVRIEMNTGVTITTRLKDGFGNQHIRFANWHDITKVRLTILSVYPGSKYQDTCLTTFGINFEERTEYEWNQMQLND